VNYTNVRFEHDFRPAEQFRSAVSLHSHTLHSRESLDFIYRLAKRVPPIRIALEQGEARYRVVHGSSLDLARAWWTPPASAHSAWNIETRHIQDRFGLNALISLSDHDDIEAPMTLQVLAECRHTPISVEWTVPYRGTFFHIGVHNIVPERARETMRELARFTTNPYEPALYDLLGGLASSPGTLIVFNHPHWDEKGIGGAAHRELARRFASEYRPFVHAFELNGLRPWRENHTVFGLAEMFAKPLVSGGDRHALEPNTILNLSNASCFAEFAEEIRRGFSTVLITKQYSEPFTLRILQSIEDILSYQENHSLGWKRWGDRVFYQGDDGVVRPLSETWTRGEPGAVRLFLGGLRLLKQPHLKQAFRLAFSRREEVIL
jgi:hypothetical protein